MVFMNELLIDVHRLDQDWLLFNEVCGNLILINVKVLFLKQRYQAVGSKNIKLSNMELLPTKLVCKSPDEFQAEDGD